MRILLCEDEVYLSNALSEVLKRNSYSLDIVYNGEDALSFIDAYNYDAIILDIMMPKLDGISVLKEIRKQNNLTPVILLTAKSQVNDKVYGLDFGADDYLTKPFDMKELLARLRVLTRRNTSSTDNILTFSNIALNRKTNELKSQKASFILASKEFQMLELLMTNPKHIIPTDRFMEKIWGYDTETEINIVWVYISYLRKKLKALDANVIIKATRNTGYSLEEM